MAWITLATLAGIGDAGAAALINTSSSLTHKAISNQIIPLLGEAFTDEPSLQAAIEAGAVAAMDDAAVQAQLAWVKGAVAIGGDYNSLTAKSGVYTRSSSASSMVNRPPFAWAANPFAVETVIISANHILQRARSITVEGFMPSAERQLFNGVWSAWKDTTEGQQALPSSTNLATFTQTGEFYARTSSIADTILDRPLDSSRNPFVVSVRLISDTTGIHEQEFVQATVGSSAFTVWRRTSLAGVYGAWHRDDSARSWDKRNLVEFGSTVKFWGDSLVAASTLPESLNALITEPVTNVGRSGDTANEVLLRAGILRLYARPTGGAIPGSGSVAVTMGGARLKMRDSRAFTANIAGVPGTLTHVSGDAWTFTRSASGSAVTVSGSAPVFIAGPPSPTDVHLFLMAENDLWWNATDAPPEGNVADHVVAAYQRAVDAIAVSAGERHVLIAGIKTAQSTVPGDAKAQLVEDVNSRLKTLFPAYYIDRQAWLATGALAAAGITPTQADVDAMAAGLVPPSAFSDDLHIKPAVAAAEAAALWLPALAERGWVTPA